MDKFRELAEEFRIVFTGRGNLIDAILPPIAFVMVNAAVGLSHAIWSSLAVALCITAFRLLKRQPLRYAFGGLGGVALAGLIAWLLSRAEGYFVPGLVTGVLTVVACVASVLLGRPFVAWMSFLTRRWPLDWYWHPQVRPAYSQVTWYGTWQLRRLGGPSVQEFKAGDPPPWTGQRRGF